MKCGRGFPASLGTCPCVAKRAGRRGQKRPRPVQCPQVITGSDTDAEQLVAIRGGMVDDACEAVLPVLWCLVGNGAPGVVLKQLLLQTFLRLL